MPLTILWDWKTAPMGGRGGGGGQGYSWGDGKRPRVVKEGRIPAEVYGKYWNWRGKMLCCSESEDDYRAGLTTLVG